MELNESTKVLPIIDKYPKVYESLLNLSSKAKRFKSPLVRKTIGKRATIQMASEILKIPIETFISTIKNAIETSGDVKPEKNRKEMMMENMWEHLKFLKNSPD